MNLTMTEISMHRTVEHGLIDIHRILGAVGPDSGQLLIAMTFEAFVLSRDVFADKRERHRDRYSDQEPRL